MIKDQKQLFSASKEKLELILEKLTISLQGYRDFDGICYVNASKSPKETRALNNFKDFAQFLRLFLTKLTFNKEDYVRFQVYFQNFIQKLNHKQVFSLGEDREHIFAALMNEYSFLAAFSEIPFKYYLNQGKMDQIIDQFKTAALSFPDFKILFQKYYSWAVIWEKMKTDKFNILQNQLFQKKDATFFTQDENLKLFRIYRNFFLDNQVISLKTPGLKGDAAKNIDGHAIQYETLTIYHQIQSQPLFSFTQTQTHQENQILLLGNFTTMFQNYLEQFNQGNLEKFETDKEFIFLVKSEEFPLIYLCNIRFENCRSPQKVKLFLHSIKKRFESLYGSSLTNWQGEVSLFEDFQKELGKIRLPTNAIKNPKNHMMPINLSFGLQEELLFFAQIHFFHALQEENHSWIENLFEGPKLSSQFHKISKKQLDQFFINLFLQIDFQIMQSCLDKITKKG